LAVYFFLFGSLALFFEFAIKFSIWAVKLNAGISLALRWQQRMILLRWKFGNFCRWNRLHLLFSAKTRCSGGIHGWIKQCNEAVTYYCRCCAAIIHLRCQNTTCHTYSVQ